jgi:hypothetical protein
MSRRSDLNDRKKRIRQLGGGVGNMASVWSLGVFSQQATQPPLPVIVVYFESQQIALIEALRNICERTAVIQHEHYQPFRVV